MVAIHINLENNLSFYTPVRDMPGWGFFYAIGKSVLLHKKIREDAHAKAIEGCRKCDAFAARECAGHILCSLF